MYTKVLAVFMCIVAVLSEAAFVDTLNKCSINDGECQKKLIQTFLKDASKTGIPEINVPPFDPVVLKDIVLPFSNVVELTLVEGTVKGLRNCIINDFRINIETRKATGDITCDLTMKGHYKAFSSSPLVKSLLGGDEVHGDGTAKVKIEKLNLKFEVHFTVENRNGDTYIKLKYDKLTTKYDVLGKVAIAANNLYVGDKDASAQITSMLNENWRLLMQTAGDTIMPKAIESISTILNRFFDNVSTKYYLIEDLTPYVE